MDPANPTIVPASPPPLISWDIYVFVSSLVRWRPISFSPSCGLQIFPRQVGISSGFERTDLWVYQ